MTEPSRLLLKLSQKLFSETSDREGFVDCLMHPKPQNSCILWCQPRPVNFPFQCEPAMPWQPSFCDRLTLGEQPGKHPLHAQGHFYCLDFSSVFAASPLLTLPTSVDQVIDVCASPGGKSIFAWNALQPKHLISNEVIGKRTAQLIANLKRCQIRPAFITRLDSKILAQDIPQTAQLVLVDAPCSGQSLLAKGGKATGCFHPVNINTNANRQKRILANSAQLVAGGGYLVYMTCTYSPEENEQVASWLLARFPHFQALEIPHLKDYRSHLAEFPCYRLFPQSGLGAGAFTIALQNTADTPAQPLPADFGDRPGFYRLTVNH